MIKNRIKVKKTKLTKEEENDLVSDLKKHPKIKPIYDGLLDSGEYTDEQLHDEMVSSFNDGIFDVMLAEKNKEMEDKFKGLKTRTNATKKKKNKIII